MKEAVSVVRDWQLEDKQRFASHAKSVVNSAQGSFSARNKKGKGSSLWQLFNQEYKEFFPPDLNCPLKYFPVPVIINDQLLCSKTGPNPQIPPFPDSQIPRSQISRSLLFFAFLHLSDSSQTLLPDKARQPSPYKGNSRNWRGRQNLRGRLHL